jgi:opacity protein-like surface antigen
MRKIIISSLIAASLSAPLMAEKSEMYFGMDVFKGNNTYTFDSNILPSYDWDNDSKGVRLKLGADLDNAWKVQGYLTIEDFDQNNFSLTGSDGNLYELGVDVIKGFPIDNKLTPFILAGISFGSMEVEGYSDDSISNVGFKLGVGLSYLFTPELEGAVGIDFKHRKWEDIQILWATIETSENIVSPYI